MEDLIMTILTKSIDGIRTTLGSFENGNDAFDLMIRDFLKEAGADNIPEYIDDDFVGVEYEGLENLVTKYEPFTEYGFDDGDENSFFLSKGFSNYYWYLSYEK
jgi:hypothetical protein